ncbi:MAG: hypothetical protein JNM69_22435 [Archangium sp.]|nr:hypothetical protein [Archangium sp.]
MTLERPRSLTTQGTGFSARSVDSTVPPRGPPSGHEDTGNDLKPSLGVSR